ncbi:MAG: histidine kinase dimerization/phospho-acceptor domain-containing protein, partial [Bacteroides sp.]
MKKSTIWILGIVMGLSFLSLLYLQVSYIEEMIKMRKEQFDESVKRSLYQASKNLEYDETLRYLEKDVADTERAMAYPSTSTATNERNIVQQTQQYTITSRDGSLYSSFELKTITTKPSGLPKAMISKNHGKNTIPQTSRTLQEVIKNRYLYQRAILDEVVYNILYTANDKPLEERVDFKNLNQYLKSELINNGIEIPYHFTVNDKEGREVYRCSDFGDDNADDFYTQTLFQNDPPSRMASMNVYFPTLSSYIFSSVKFIIPSLMFTFVLLITFIFTIYSIFRQKKLTEIKNDFINNMTHEFKTPISTISLAAQMLQDPAVGKSPQMFQHISRVINDETKRLRFQVEKVLQMSMFERQKAILKMKEIDANELITSVINTFTLKVEKYNGKISSSLEAADPIIFV